jgi:hypothetical protein
VNGRQYGYFIWDGCPAGVSVGDAVEIPIDTTTTRFTAVATPENIQLGGYYLGLTRDDVGGLKYLYSKDNFMYQTLDDNSLAIPTAGEWTPVDTNATAGGLTNFSGIFGGVEKITFVRANFNPLLGPNFNPITYHYTVPMVGTNGRLSQLSIARTINTPDVLFTAADLVSNNLQYINDTSLFRSGSFITNGFTSAGGGITGSTINPQMVVTLNDVGALYYNSNPYFMDNTNTVGYPIFIWGSFDGTTNAPIVYPSGTSIQYLIEQILEGGATPPGGNWSPVVNPNSTNTTTTGSGTGGVGTGGAGVGVGT